MDEIINGKPMSCFPGLLGYINKYLAAETAISANTRKTIGNYLEIIRQRAAGETPTAAHWMRDFVMQHPSYKHDSRIPPDTAYDLMKEVVLYGDNNKALERFGIVSHCVEHIVACYEKMVPSELGKRKSLSSIASPLEASAPFSFAPDDNDLIDAATAAPAANGVNGHHAENDAETIFGKSKHSNTKPKNGIIKSDKKTSDSNGVVANGNTPDGWIDDKKAA